MNISNKKRTITISAMALAAATTPGMAQADTTNGYGVAAAARAAFAYDGNYFASAYRTGTDSSGNWTVVADTPGVQIMGCQNQPPSSGVLCNGSATGTGSSSGTDYNLTSATANANRSDNGGYDPTSFSTGIGQARSSLAFGELGVLASSDKFKGVLAGPIWNGGSAFAQMNDTLTFNVAGAGASTVTNITIRFDLDGSLSSAPFQPGQASIDEQLYFGSANARYGESFGMGNDTPFYIANGWVSYTWENTGSNSLRFTGVYALSGISGVIGIDNRMLAYGNQGGLADYFGTSKLSLLLPSNVTYTSASGTFLSALDPGLPGAVPEPSTWALMLAGFGAIGVAMRRHRVKRISFA